MSSLAPQSWPGDAVGILSYMMSLIWVLSYWEIKQLESGLQGKNQMREDLLASLHQARSAPACTLQPLAPARQCQIPSTRPTGAARRA